MQTLYHYPLCPLSRKVRLLLSEMQVDYKMVVQKFWVKDEKFQSINPLLSVPFIQVSEGTTIAGSQAIVEYFDEIRSSGFSFMGEDPITRAEVRRMIFAFEDKCYNEATKHILYERVYKFFESSGIAPNLEVLTGARSSLPYFLKYLSFILERSDWAVGTDITAADLTIAAHLSSLDYLGEILWDNYPTVKHWYSIIKSRPSFGNILADSIPGFPPMKHYRLLDF